MMNYDDKLILELIEFNGVFEITCNFKNDINSALHY